jgi:hypothetical protein
MRDCCSCPDGEVSLTVFTAAGQLVMILLILCPFPIRHRPLFWCVKVKNKMAEKPNVLPPYKVSMATSHNCMLRVTNVMAFCLTAE